MKFCSNCVHFEGLSCKRTTKHNLVTGEAVAVLFRAANTERTTPFPSDILLGRCGKRGRFYQNKYANPNGFIPRNPPAKR